MRVSFIVALVAAFPLVADDKKAPADAPLKGKWELTTASFNGANQPGLAGRILVFDDKEFSTYDGDQKGRTLSFTLDPKADPKRIDLDRGGDAGKALGIYSVDKDELKICYAEPKAARPGKFETKGGDKVFLLVLKRVTD